MRIYACDRCGKAFKIFETQKNTRIAEGFVEYDLCLDCTKEFRTFMNFELDSMENPCENCITKECGLIDGNECDKAKKYMGGRK